MNKIYKWIDVLTDNLTFDEISRMYREILYYKYCDMKEFQEIHMYQLTTSMIDILEQMINGRKFDEKYLKDKIKW